ncbi:MAG: hypothetical protein C0594_06890 [Marinilabiliales bacterium]|nr:MAG: hypothetical protein C0594_06890 [Marinilabiliales bacterium]
MKEKSKKYMNSYLAGFLLGLTLLAAFFFTGRGLGASGAPKSVIVAAVDLVAHEHAKSSPFYSKYIEKEEPPIKAWLVLEVLGVLMGGLISGALAGRLNLKIEHSPKISSKTRLVFALLGGILFGAGAQLGRGCTSGAALSGMAVLSTAGFVTMLAIFGTGYVLAFFVKKLWI